MNVLDAEKQRVMSLQAPLVRADCFFLAGGTGLALRLRHRVSRDVDWFTPKAFDASELASRLASLPEKPSELVVQGPHTLRAYYGSLETSFIRYTQVPARPELLDAGGLQVPIADFETQAVMKAAAVHDRGTRRDFIDIHAICSAPGWSVASFIDLATRRLPLQPGQMKLALTYFIDADRQEVPIAYRTPWKQVKADLERGVRDWERIAASAGERSFAGRSRREPPPVEALHRRAASAVSIRRARRTPGQHIRRDGPGRRGSPSDEPWTSGGRREASGSAEQDDSCEVLLCPVRIFGEPIPLPQNTGRQRINGPGIAGQQELIEHGLSHTVWEPPFPRWRDRSPVPSPCAPIVTSTRPRRLWPVGRQGTNQRTAGRAR